MASLSVSQAIELIKKPKNAREIVKARYKRYRHRLHTETDLHWDDALYMQPQHAFFLNWVQNILKSDDNFDRFKNRYRPPLATNEFTETIFSQFEKVFESENKYERFNFTDPDLEGDWYNYRKNIGDFTFWETQGFETMKNSIDNVLICDLPRAGESIVTGDDLPQPYYYFLDIDNLIDIDNVRVKAVDYAGNEQTYFFKTEYVIFWESKTVVCVFDDGHFRSFNYDASTTSVPVLISEIPHDLKYCPARSFWTTPLNSKTTFLKRSPITTSLSKMDQLLYVDTASDCLKDYALYPIYAVFKSVCKYTDTAQNTKCQDGWMWLNGKGASGVSQKTNQRCPKCSKIKTGPGNILEVNSPQDRDQPNLMDSPMKVIPADVESVEINETTVQKLKESIFSACVGGGIEQDDTQAKNMDQVKSAFEGKTNKLLWIKKNFEAIHSFACDTIAALRYGDKYIGGTIDYGDKFFQKDESVEIAEYKIAKEEEFPAFDLAIRRDMINETRYRNNPDMIERLRILSNLDPFPDDDVVSLTETLDNAPELIDPIDVCIKVHFDKFIKRFEREQASLLLFGSALDFDKKISQIEDVLRGYATDLLTARKVNIEKYPITTPPPAPVVPVERVKGAPAPVA